MHAGTSWAAVWTRLLDSTPPYNTSTWWVSLCIRKIVVFPIITYHRKNNFVSTGHYLAVKYIDPLLRRRCGTRCAGRRYTATTWAVSPVSLSPPSWQVLRKNYSAPSLLPPTSSITSMISARGTHITRLVGIYFVSNWLDPMTYELLFCSLLTFIWQLNNQALSTFYLRLPRMAVLLLQSLPSSWRQLQCRPWACLTKALHSRTAPT